MTEKPEKSEKSKMGRPPLPPGKKRGPSMGFRPTPGIRGKLEGAARANGRSMSQEVEERLGQSFKEDEVLGGMRLRALLLLFGNAAALVEHETGKSCFEDWDTWLAVQAAWKSLGTTYCAQPSKEWRRALEEASDAVTDLVLRPIADDAEPSEQMEELKKNLIISTFHRYQADDRAKGEVGRDIVAQLLAEKAKKES